MIGDMQTWTALLITLAVASGVVRLTLRRRAASVATRGPAWRFAGLIGLQGLAGLLLHLTLFPPSAGTPPGRLVVATQGATPKPRDSSDVLVALPEAGPVAGAIQVPDLGSALRLYPGLGQLRIEGQGLTPRDQIALDRPAEFAPSKAPVGLIDLTLPEPVAPGARFTVVGQVGTLAGGSVELLDPAGAVVDQALVASGGRFSLSATARIAGQALFDLRLKDTSGRQIERVAVPVEVRAQRPPRVLILAGTASPETKYLRRWAQDAGLDLKIEIDLGGGVQMGDAPTPLARASLAQLDLVVVDDRRWETLSPGARAALGAATQDGLGLLLRPTGPLSAATRRQWADLGLATAGGDNLLAFQLNGSGPATTPPLQRHDLVAAGREGVPMIRDRTGTVLAVWRPRGQGRVGLWSVADSYALALTGQPERHGALWSALFSTLSRPGDDLGPALKGLARTDERAALCPVSGDIRVIDPAGLESRPRADPATVPALCAAYWPRRAGWHTVLNGDRQTAFYVHPAQDAPSLAHNANRLATLDLIKAAPSRASRSVPPRPGSPWPWAMGLLSALALLWWLERRSPPDQLPR